MGEINTFLQDLRLKIKLTPNGKILLNGKGINYLKPIYVTQDNSGFNNSGAGLWHLFHPS